MAKGVVDGLEVIDVDQGNHRVPLLLLARLELELQQVLPGTVVEQPGQAVGQAQGAQPALVVAQLDRKLVAHPAQGQWVQRQHWQARIDLQGRGDQLQARAKQQDGGEHASQLRQRSAKDHALAAGGDVVHRHHRQHGHAG
ncbi:hypothetical protein D3C75_751400 [compost metagenome]